MNLTVSTNPSCIKDLESTYFNSNIPEIKVGDTVYVVQKTKKTPGVVKKVNIKKAIVDMRGGSYNVPLSMIEVA